MIEERSRSTICDGRVVDFATEFHEEPGAFGPVHHARGPFHISASRNAVVVHRAELSSPGDVENFAAAMDLAIVEFNNLK